MHACTQNPCAYMYPWMCAEVYMCIHFTHVSIVPVECSARPVNGYTGRVVAVRGVACYDKGEITLLPGKEVLYTQ